MPARPTTRAKVLALLAVHGRLSVSQIAELLGMNKNTVGSAVRISYARGLLHIAGWKRSYGTRGRMGPMYAAGNGIDVLPPEPDRNADSRRYWKNKGRAKYGVTKPVNRFNPWAGLAPKRNK